MPEEQMKSEKTIADLERSINEVRDLAKGIEQHTELTQLQQQLEMLQNAILCDLKPIDQVRLSRHVDRPYTLDYIQLLFTEFSEIHGDRRFADDAAMVCGMARFNGEQVAVIGHQKGRDIKSRQHRNFGMAKPEGYRKALRVMQLAEKFKRPIFTFVDTPGAFPGIEAEERNIAESIAHNLREMARLRVP